MQALSDKPVINLESAINHPCQALAAWKTLDDLSVPERARFVLSWVPHPRALPLAVPAAILDMAVRRGHEVLVLRPDGYALPAAIMERARAVAAESGGSVSESGDRDALAGARVVYAKEWGSTRHYGDAAADAALRAGLKDWQLTESLLRPCAADCRVMHCLPVRRNVAIADAVLDGPRSIVQAEARNRLNVQMAVLHRLLASS
jgi:N-acetylornithine carbamoyltransferase